MKKILVTLFLAVLMLLPAGMAQAATYKWANTHVVFGQLRVEFCTGQKGYINQDSRTPSDVCKFYLAYNQEILVYVEETGTMLYDTAYCGSAAGKWYTFTSSTDTSRTANVTRTRANCL